MSPSPPLNEELAGGDDGGLEVASIGEAQYVFEDKNMDYTEEGSAQHEFDIQLGEENPDVSATVLWKHVVKGKKCGSAHGGSHVFRCKHCHKIYHGTYTRVYAHLMGHKKGESKGIGHCSAVKADTDLQLQIKREVEQVECSPNVVPLKKSKLNTISAGLTSVGLLPKDSSAQDKEAIDSKVIRCLCANGIPFNVLRSPYWDEMVSAISRAPGYTSPSYETAHTVLLENERVRVEKEFDDFKQKLPQYGISIVSNSWMDVKNQPLINIFASNQFGSMFLHAVDYLVIEKSPQNISDYILEATEKVGPNNVVQLITDNSANCMAACEEVVKVYPYIVWTPCLVHTSYLILKDTIRALPWLDRTYTTAKGIVKYIIYHSQAIEIFHSYSKLELLKITRGYASHYTTLRLLLDVREVLVQAILSEQWEIWASFPSLCDKVTPSGNEVKAGVMSDNFWEAVRLALCIIKPIYRVIKFTIQDGPLVGEVCERMDTMLGEIKDGLLGHEDVYMTVKEKVTSRWCKKNVPLQCLAYALTPKYYDEEYLQVPAPGGRKRCSPDQDDEVFDVAMDAISKMYLNDELSDTVRVQFMSFVEKKGKFSSPTAKRDARNPKINVLQWWKFHGGDTKELREMAFRVLGQPVSTLSFERPWSTYSYIHNMKRLNTIWEDDLIYIHSNLRILSRSSSSYKYGPQRKWDVNPELPVVDEIALQWEDIGLLGLGEDNPLLEHISHSDKPIQELLKIMTNAPSSSSSNQSGEQSQFIDSMPANGIRVDLGGGGMLNPKGKTKKFL